MGELGECGQWFSLGQATVEGGRVSCTLRRLSPPRPNPALHVNKISLSYSPSGSYRAISDPQTNLTCKYLAALTKKKNI